MAVKVLKGSSAEKYMSHLADGPPENVVKQAKGSVLVTKGGVVLKDEEEVLNKGVMVKKDELCTVTVGGSHTINLGNYESAKITVMVSLPCYKNDLEETYEFASSWVSGKLEEAVSQVKG